MNLTTKKNTLLYPTMVIALLAMPHCSDSDKKDINDAGIPKDTDPVDAGEDTHGDDTDTDTEPSAILSVDDFEDGDNISLLGGQWYAYDDKTTKGASSIEITEDKDGNIVMDGEGYESSLAMTLSFDLDQGEYEYEPYVGWGISMGGKTSPFDASEYVGISYVYKGSAHSCAVEIFDVEDYDHYSVELKASSEWTAVTLPFTSFSQGGWGKAVSLNLDNVKNIAWQVKGKTGDSGTVTIDNVGLLGGTVEPPEKDLTIEDPQPPVQKTPDVIKIDNPLQDLAMSALNKGYNLTNWLEEGKFESYAFDEDYINDLAANGFKALRLPIDLDRYIENRDDYFAGTAEYAVEDLLFEILDNFDKWTAAAGMSLTVDYHQYDESFDMTDERYTDAAIRLWTDVAEHFADNEREDLFFEIMNEPELAGGTTAVSQTEWTAFAEKIIEGIRSADTSHVILFGDVDWNSISALTKRTPFEDDKIIYVFHFYEPFIFTHQGASWSGLGTTHDIPYPYSKDRWSEYSSDFGFGPSQEGWHFSALRAYYQNGNKTRLYNQVAEAKQWAVENNVPVLCNEFGVYERAVQEEDLINYYTDIADIFESLEIPWQIWFMIMDKTEREVDADLKEAFGLK